MREPLNEVLVVGGGGREDALMQEVARSRYVDRVMMTPGNANTAMHPKGINVMHPHEQPVLAREHSYIVEIAHDRAKEVIIGPEVPLVGGLGDELREYGLPVFGPGADGAQLEGSKAYADRFMEEFGVQRPPSFIAEKYNEGLEFIQDRDPTSYVIKADGLADGKGVVLPRNFKEAFDAITDMFLKGGYGGAGKEKVIFQDRYHGPEFSAFMLVDGESYMMLPVFSQDHKRLGEGDEGPNTGGMGAYSPVELSMKHLNQLDDMAGRTFEGLLNRGINYQGVVYFGLMAAEELDGDLVNLEYNVRFGDPEAQVILPMLNQQDPETVYNLLKATAHGDLSNVRAINTPAGAAITVCLASSGYPTKPMTGNVIHGLDKTYDGVLIHHGSTKRKGEHILTKGGRVIYVTALGETIDIAAQRAYAAIGEKAIHFAGMQFRKDIGWQVRSNR